MQLNQDFNGLKNNFSWSIRQKVEQRFGFFNEAKKET